MEGDHVVGFPGFFAPCGERLALSFQLIHARDEGVRRHAFDDEIDDALDLAFDLAKAPIDPVALGARFLLEALALFIVAIDECPDYLGMREVLTQSLDRQCLDIVEIDPPPVRAGAAFLVGRALNAHAFAIGAVRRHAAATATAFDQARKDPLGCARLLYRFRRRVVASFGLDDLRGLECLIVNDAQMRRLDNLILILRVGARQALARHRIFDHAHLVPNDATGIEIVQDYAATARHIAVDGRRAPKPTTRWPHAALVEMVSDLPRGLACGVVSKNLANDFGFFLDNLQLAWLSGRRAITERATAGVPPIADHTFHAASAMDSQVFEKHLAHQRTQRAVSPHLCATAIGHPRVIGRYSAIP